MIFGFLATALWFPLCYLAWFGRPNLRPFEVMHKLVFWSAAIIWAYFWSRMAFTLWDMG
jgi:hypothetical protein